MLVKNYFSSYIDPFGTIFRKCSYQDVNKYIRHLNK